MKPIEDLRMEHEAVKITLRVLDSICKQAEKTGEMASPEHLEQLIEFFTTFVDRCHHGKEEELLFPALEEVGVSREGGPIGVMLKEHQQGRDHVAKMKAALIRYREGDRGAAGDIVHHARAYICSCPASCGGAVGSFFPDARIFGAGFFSTNRYTCPRRFFAAFIQLFRFCRLTGCGIHIFANTGLVLADFFIGYGYG